MASILSALQPDQPEASAGPADRLGVSLTKNRVVPSVIPIRMDPTVIARSDSLRNPVAMSSPGGCHLATPTRVALAAELGEALDGAWWPQDAAVGRELPLLIEALKRPFGPIIDIGVNWSNLAGMPNLNSMDWRGNSLVSIREARRQRVITLTGRRATTKLLLVPPRTSTALAVMLMRQAARLPIRPSHRETDAFRMADQIIRCAYTETSTDATSAVSSS